MRRHIDRGAYFLNLCAVEAETFPLFQYPIPRKLKVWAFLLQIAMTSITDLKDNGVTVHNCFERQHCTTAVVNVDPSDADRAAEMLREWGYEIASFEELEDAIDGTRFTRINLREPGAS